MIGSKVVVKCSAGGMPEPSITWRVNGVPLHGGSQCRPPPQVLDWRC